MPVHKIEGYLKIEGNVRIPLGIIAISEKVSAVLMNNSAWIR
jgi:hypothetical protein